MTTDLDSPLPSNQAAYQGPSACCKRRTFLRRMGFAAAALLPVAAVETYWLRIRTVRVTPEPKYRILHFSDLHYKRPLPLFAELVDAINRLKPDFACFTGDLLEKKRHLPAVLDLFRRIQCPVFGVPGNHERWSGVINERERLQAAFAETGGAWLHDSGAYASKSVWLYGLSGLVWKTPSQPETPVARRILLCHYPKRVERIAPNQFELMLAGHSHGGQVRMPLLGAPIVPNEVRPYDLGLYHTPACALHVSAGIGTYGLPLRLWCPPEVTVLEV